MCSGVICTGYMACTAVCTSSLPQGLHFGYDFALQITRETSFLRFSDYCSYTEPYCNVYIFPSDPSGSCIPLNTWMFHIMQSVLCKWLGQIMKFNYWGSNLINIQGHIQNLECYFPIRAMYQMEGKRLNTDDFLHWLVIFFQGSCYSFSAGVHVQDAFFH